MDAVIISPSEFRAKMKMYFDLANDRDVIIQKGKVELYRLSRVNTHTESDVSRALSKDELMEGITKGIRDIYMKRR